MSRRKNSSKLSVSGPSAPALRISEVARRVGISSSALRAGADDESVGLDLSQHGEEAYVHAEGSATLLRETDPTGVSAMAGEVDKSVHLANA